MVGAGVEGRVAWSQPGGGSGSEYQYKWTINFVALFDPESYYLQS